jgi:hypothetical protein
MCPIRLFDHLCPQLATATSRTMINLTMEKNRMRPLLVCLLLLCFVVPTRALDDADREAIRDVITKQMESFKADDAAGAFSYAAPVIKQMFRDADTFMRMVRSGYAPVYRPKSATFGELTNFASGITQTVTIVDAEGNFWTAIYTMEKEDGGQWRISGCRILKAPTV